MKLLLSLALVFSVVLLSAQTKPSNFTEETNPNNSNFEFYSQKGDSSRRATFNNMKKNMVPDVNTTPIAYVPASTGNASNRTQFVQTAGDSIYYIDGYGDAFLLYDPTDTVLVGSITNDTLFVNNLELPLTAYRQTIDTFSLAGSIVSLSLSGDNVAAETIDLSSFVGLDSIKAGQLLSSTGDSIYLISDTLTSDITWITEAITFGRFRLLPVATIFQLNFVSDNNNLYLGSLLNYIQARDTTLNLVLDESLPNTGAIIVTDNRTTTSGIEYEADYSAGFVPRSLVDKGYVAGVGKRDNAQAEVTSKVTATLYSILPVNSTSGAVGVTVPSSPAPGDWFAVSDSRGTAGSNNITIEFTTAPVNFHGGSADHVISASKGFARFTYVNSTIGWIISN
jgi:hypothetical protein